MKQPEYKREERGKAKKEEEQEQGEYRSEEAAICLCGDVLMRELTAGMEPALRNRCDDCAAAVKKQGIQERG